MKKNSKTTNNKKSAAKMSTKKVVVIVLAVVILAAVLMEGFDFVQGGGAIGIDFLPLALGVLTAMISGYIAINFMLKIIKKANYKWFSVYLILISIANLVVYLV